MTKLTEAWLIEQFDTGARNKLLRNAKPAPRAPWYERQQRVATMRGVIGKATQLFRRRVGQG